MNSTSAFRHTSRENRRFFRIERIIIVSFALAVLLGIVKHLDIVVRAPGIVVTQEGARTLIAKRNGIVSKFHVEEGGFVNAGDLLVSLSDPELEIQLDGVMKQLVRVNSEIVIAKAILHNMHKEELLDRLQNQGVLSSEDYSNWIGFFHATQDLDKREQILNAEQIHKLEIDEDLAKSKTLRLAGIVADYKERHEALRELYGNGSLPKVEFVDSKVELARLKENKIVESDNARKIQQQIQNYKAKVDWERSQKDASRRQRLLELEDEKSRLENDSERLQKQLAELELYAPISGTVQEPAIELLQQSALANPLLVLVSTGETFEVLARLRSRDIAFVDVGQPAKLLMDAYSMVRFGTLDGTVKSVTQDTAKVETQIPVPLDITDKRRLQSDISQTQNLPTYLIRLSIKDRQNGIQLRPGMSSVVNIKTGERRLISFFLDPFYRALFSSIKER